MIEIAENLADWQREYTQGWLAHWQRTGETNFRLYRRVQNHTAVSGQGVQLNHSRLLFISSAGGYLPETQQPFAATDPLGDYSLRLLPTDTPLHQIAYAHDHYDQTAVSQDPQVLLPLRHLAEMVQTGTLAALTPQFISYMGYQPDVSRIIDELIPAIIGHARDQQADAALLVPA